MPFIKGVAANPNGNRRMDPVVRFNLQQAARSHCEESLKVVAACLKSDDERVRLMAATIMFERGFGKAPVTAAVNVQHKFAVVPQTMDKASWLERGGAPEGTPVYRPPAAKHLASKDDVLDLEANPDPAASQTKGLRSYEIGSP